MSNKGDKQQGIALLIVSLVMLVISFIIYWYYANWYAVGNTKEIYSKANQILATRDLTYNYYYRTGKFPQRYQDFIGEISDEMYAKLFSKNLTGYPFEFTSYNGERGYVVCTLDKTNQVYQLLPILKQSNDIYYNLRAQKIISSTCAKVAGENAIFVPFIDGSTLFDTNFRFFPFVFINTTGMLSDDYWEHNQQGIQIGQLGQDLALEGAGDQNSPYFYFSSKVDHSVVSHAYESPKDTLSDTSHLMGQQFFVFPSICPASSDAIHGGIMLSGYGVSSRQFGRFGNTTRKDLFEVNTQPLRIGEFYQPQIGSYQNQAWHRKDIKVSQYGTGTQAVANTPPVLCRLDDLSLPNGHKMNVILMTMGENDLFSQIKHLSSWEGQQVQFVRGVLYEACAPDATVLKAPVTRYQTKNNIPVMNKKTLRLRFTRDSLTPPFKLVLNHQVVISVPSYQTAKYVYTQSVPSHLTIVDIALSESEAKAIEKLKQNYLNVYVEFRNIPAFSTEYGKGPNPQGYIPITVNGFDKTQAKVDLMVNYNRGCTFPVDGGALPNDADALRCGPGGNVDPIIPSCATNLRSQLSALLLKQPQLVSHLRQYQQDAIAYRPAG